MALLVWCTFPWRSYFCCGYEAKSLLNPFPGKGCGMEFVPKFRVLIRTRSARFCQKYFGMGYAQSPTPSSLPLSWPLYKVNVVPAGTPLPSHIRAEGENGRPTPALQLGLYPLYSHCGSGGGAQDSVGMCSGVLLEIAKGPGTESRTPGTSGNLCALRKKNGFPQDGSRCRHYSQESKFKAGIGVLDPEITFLPFSLSLIFHFQQKEEDMSECRGVRVYTHNDTRVPVCACGSHRTDPGIRGSAHEYLGF